MLKYSILKKHRLVLLGLMSGFALFLSWPPYGIPFLIFLAFVPLLFAEHILLENKQTNRSSMFFKLTYLAFFTFNLSTTWWISQSTLPGMVVAVVLNSFFMAVPWWLVHVWRRLSPMQGWLPLLFLWLSFEHLHSQWELSWSWLDLGNVFSTVPSIVQWYEYTGVAGGTLWVLIVNLLAFSIFKEALWLKEKKSVGLQEPTATSNYKMGSKKRPFLFLGIFVGCLLIPIVFSLVTYWTYTEIERPLEVVIVQPSEDPYHHPSSAEQFAMVDKLITLSAGVTTSKTAFVLSPEAALPEPVWLGSDQKNQVLERLKDFLAQNENMHWVTGASIFQIHDNDEELPFTARQIPSTNINYTIFNSAIIVNKEGLLNHYHKSKLVPGVEAVPYASVFKPLGWVFSKFGGTAKGMGKQKHRSVFGTKDGAVIGPVICFESIFGDYMTEYARLGANVIFIATNDGWWGKTPGYRQHSNYARLRAIELRKPIARAASTGISSFIDQRGKLIQQTKWGQEVAIRQTLNLNNRLTYFAARGNVLGKASLFFSALFVVAVFVQTVLGKKLRIS